MDFQGLKKSIVQISTTYSSGTGFVVQELGVVITNEHIVRDSPYAILCDYKQQKFSASILFIDEQWDLAFIELPKGLEAPEVNLQRQLNSFEGDKVWAFGHPYGNQFAVAEGIISNSRTSWEGIHYIRHSAELQMGYSGGPLINEAGDFIGINTFVLEQGKTIGYALPMELVKADLDLFSSNDRKPSIVCPSCRKFILEEKQNEDNCSNCGYLLPLIKSIPPVELNAVAYTIEHVLEELGYNPVLSRAGLNAWEIKRGSAKVEIKYHEESGLIDADAQLVKLPKERVLSIYSFLLQQNGVLEGLNFSVRNDDIILSLLIYDQFLHQQTCGKLFARLFERADHFDNILVEEFGAIWNNET